MTGDALWWSALATGTILVTLAGVVSMTRAFRGRRVPRLGFLPPHEARPQRWLMAALVVGIVLLVVGADRLTGTFGTYVAHLGGAVAVSSLVQAAFVSRHNHRLPPETGRDAAPDGRRGVADS